ncbi:MAG: 2-C-methyl-D-erythritol 2,4-cyclodiphosphate synthase [Chloroflexi bacterium]|nr:2-C-methyl-D-erythritol 2,4-cyclodiphosphate synthase [Chloroflexota bacterium]
MASRIQVGIGYDVHPLAAGRRLILGGVAIPFDKGLQGWSDGDALTHAIIDALLGAAALGNIGQHFPPGDPQYKDISSLELLKRVSDELKQKGWAIGNIDATVIAEKPKLRDFIDSMRGKISEMLGIEISQVSVKATTSEEMGFVGRGEGMAVMAVALIEQRLS